MERIWCFDRNEIPKVLASFQKAGIDSNEDPAGAPIVWIVKNGDLKRAVGILKEHNVRAVHKPWD